MKKHLLRTMLMSIMMVFGAMGAWADTETVTVLSEDYESYDVGDITATMTGKGWKFQSRNGKNQITIVQGADDAVNTTKYFDFYYPDGGASRNQSWNFGVSSSLNADNWKLTFSAALNPGTNNSANKFWITGANTGKITDANADVTNPIFGLIGTAAAAVTYKPSIGTTAYDEEITLTSGTWYKFTIEATGIDAGNTKANLTVKITSYDGATTVWEKTVNDYNLSTSGTLKGLCWNSPRGYSRLSLDDVLVTKEVSADICADPTFTVTGTDGTSRKVAIACETSGATIYYASSELEKGAAGWSTYTDEITTDAATIYAYAAKGAITSEVVSFATGAGEAISLNAPVIVATGFVANGDIFNPIFTATNDQTTVQFTPTATMTATFNGASVELPYTVTEDGTLVVTVAAEGYNPASTEMSLKAKYTKSWSSSNFSALTEEDIPTVLGENWQKQDATGRWASWTSDKEPYTYYAAVGDEAVFNVTVEDNLRMRNVVQLNLSYGLARNVTGGEAINFLNSKAGTIAEVTYYNGYGADVSEANTHNTYLFNAGEGIPSFSTTNGNVFVQATYYTPVVENKGIFLKPGVWNVDGARYAAYTFGDGEAWFDFAAAEEDGVYTVNVPDNYSGLILVRMNGETTENNWDNKWNQTADIDFTAVADNTLFTITGWETTDFETSKYEVSVPGMNTYTATFTTNAGWGEVYAYAWTTEDGNTTEFLGAWPGTKLEDNEGVYTATIEAAAAPAYIIFNNGGNGAQTADLTFEDGKAYEFTISDEWAAAIAAAAAEAEEDGVAVGKLIEAIAKAQGQTGTDEEKAALQAAVDQYKADNAPQETDLTSQFSALTDWQKWTGATGYTATNYCPTVDINDGTKKQVCEKYETTCATTGDIFYQTVTGLTTGTYKIELYGGAAFTFGRGFGSMAFTGEIGTGDAWGTHNSDTYTAGQHIDTETGVKMYAITSEGTYEEEIPIYYATNFPDGAATVVLDGVKVGVNGEVKIGMNKTSQSTNWHVVQLKGVTAQVLAKDLYAAHQTELQALVAEAQALAADENKTEGKEAFQEALTTAELAVNSQWYNNAEIEGIINNLKNAIANFKKANYFIDFAAGEYYVIDAESGKMMAAGSSYGTRGIVNETGLDLTLTPYTESRTVTFDSRVANNENDHFLGINLYMDSSSWGWALEYQGFGFYIKDPDGGKYINLDENDNLVLSDTPREFIIVTKDGVMEERKEELADATETNPVDATFLLQNPNFNRNDQRVSAWEWIPSETPEENADNWNNHNFNGGNQVNNCAESYHAAFVVKQTVSGAPAGKYTMTAQGFYRQDTFDGDAPAAPMFFANGVNKDVPAKTGEENSMSMASESFTSGLYTIEPVEFEVADDGMIYVGVTAAVHNQWVIFDNFQLKYYGKKDITDGISVIETEVLNGNVYNLQGQKVTKAQKGLFIVNGKKVVMK